MDDKNFVIYYKALHRAFLVVLVVDVENKLFRGAYLPVDGFNHKEEAKNWKHGSTKTSTADLNHFFPSQLAHHRDADPDFTFA